MKKDPRDRRRVRRMCDHECGAYDRPKEDGRSPVRHLGRWTRRVYPEKHRDPPRLTDDDRRYRDLAMDR